MNARLATLVTTVAVLLARPVELPAGEGSSPVQYVNPMIGTAPAVSPSARVHGLGTENSAQTIPEVTAPFGMTNWTPQTRHVETKCIAPYYYNDSLINGFRGSHWLSGSCTQDYGSVTLMPMAGSLRTSPGSRGCRYSHAGEISTPYYYKVGLADLGVEAELTATRRCGLARFTFAGNDTASILIEPNSDEGEGSVSIAPDRREIAGCNPVHRIYQGWGERAGFSGYFVARFSDPFDQYGVYEGDALRKGVTDNGNKKGIGAYVRFTGKRRTIVVRVGTSFTSIDEARRNLDAEAATLTFDGAKTRLRDEWTTKLSRVAVDGGTKEQRVKFYTALYHSLLLPRLYNDCDGSYPSFAGGDSTCNAGTGAYYCDFSMWDTYRALHPLFNVLFPDVNADMVRSLLLKARQGGWLPIFPCWNSYTSAMIGDHAIAAIADAVVKNGFRLTGEDYAYLRKNATQLPTDHSEYVNGKGVRALDSYMRLGYIPLDDSVKDSFHTMEQVSRTLEYAYDDFALSQIAGAMGKADDQKLFLARSKNYRNVFNADVNCVCGRFADGTFTSQFSKTERMPYITEGTPWQYTWYVPHDVDGLISLMGGKEAFEQNLDAFFKQGQYWHGNEPDQQVPFLFNATAHPWKTQLIVRQILEAEYGTDPGGLSGNDDSGQMSAWYVFASIGLYPVCPAKPEYALTAPAFERITLRLPRGRKLEIRAPGVSRGKNVVASVRLNGKRLQGWELKHHDLMQGGKLDFEMRSNPPGTNEEFLNER
jgi:predicted alpha-1,2-mannosidase